MIRSVLVAALLLSGGLAGRQEPQQASRDLAQAIQRHYDQVRDFKADFTHIYEGGVLRRKAVEHGEMAVRKPGKMRWTYTRPEEKVFVSDGRKLYSYVPADRQVYVASVPAADEASTPALFLAGKGDLMRDFTPERVDPAGMPADTVALKLTPRRPEREYESLVLVVERDSYRLRQLITEDRQGGKSTFVFENLKENTGIPDKTFVFSIPRGVDVITDAGR